MKNASQMNRKQLSIAVAICTFNRHESLKKCLQTIEQQTLQPQQLIIIEKISNTQTISLEELKNQFPDTEISYQQVKDKNIAHSRNLAIKKLKKDIILFVDDDVLLTKNYLRQLVELYQKEKNVCAIVGRIRPIKNHYWSNFIHRILTYTLKNENRKQIVKVWPALNSSFLKQCFEKTKFDENMTALEDIDFCHNLEKNGYKILYIPQLVCFHNYRNSALTFYKTFFRYYKNNIIYLEKKEKTYDRNIAPLITLYKNNKLSTFRSLASTALRVSNSHRLDMQLPKKYLFANLIYYLVWHHAVLASR